MRNHAAKRGAMKKNRTPPAVIHVIKGEYGKLEKQPDDTPFPPDFLGGLNTLENTSNLVNRRGCTQRTLDLVSCQVKHGVRLYVMNLPTEDLFLKNLMFGHPPPPPVLQPSPKTELQTFLLVM